MSIDNVFDVVPRVQYVAAASQTAFDYPFAIFADGDIVVDVDDVIQTLTTDYVVTGAGDDTGGTVTMVVALDGDEIVTLYRDTSIERTTDFQQNGPMASTSFNDELDRVFIILQELTAKVGRAVRFPFTATATDAQTELSPLSNWLGRFLRVSAAGVLEAADLVSSVVPLTQSLIGQLLNPQTQAETDAGATPINWWQPVATALRYANNSVPGTTNMTAAIQMAMDVVFYEGGDTLRLSYGLFMFNADLRPLISLSPLRRTFCIIGAGMEATTLTTPNASGLLIYGDTPNGGANVMVSFRLDRFGIANTSGSRLNSGIDLYHCQRASVGQVRVTGFNYGLRARSTWNFSCGDRAQLDLNNVGLKVPRQGADNVGFNAAQISGLSCANNFKAGISIGCGNVITIEDILMESNPVAVYLVEGLAHVRFSTAYYEGSGPAPTEPDRYGTDVVHLLITGRDEDGVVGDTAQPIKDLQLGCLMDHAGEGIIYLDNVDGVTFLNHEYGRNYVTLGPNAKNIVAPTISGLDSVSSPLTQGKSKSTVRKVLRNLSQNWVPNGAFNLQNLPYLTFTGSATAAITTQTIDSVLARVLDITCPGGQTTLTVEFVAEGPVGAEYATGNSLLNASIHAIANSADFASVTLGFFDNNGTSLTGNAAKTSGLESLFVLSAQANPNEHLATTRTLGIRITITRTTGVGDAHLYIDEIAVFPDNHAMLTTLSALDIEVGLSGTGVCSTGSGAWFYTDIVTGFLNQQYFTFTATPVYDAAQTATDIQFEKLSGGSEGTVRVWSNKNGAGFSYRIIPRVMRMP